uniref:3-hydroxyacyl-CoA dehydrogenase NAD binding domain-containing protein n=1 Tax=Chromera velia CCMP2878 TaxID=1169474 RepID=A0A0G4G624_9ALVE|eukprot:Cvel_20411.t1-p1 / transcript=Cvel_20411.t1 / gene=Cvel_20411 / organism=Chromera_velia_CCMP2878 / gene_product=Lambda-crystallin, putative / transcript_product=Lambda-crystallin, putative / location=Cvel_scaffold1828:18056-21001(-) / protein_length=321 / sequence_SO=supercontig / SO=protein_coding / is_pseudo=false
MAEPAGKIGIIGSGLIGQQWAMLFSSGGFEVVMYDKDKNALAAALPKIEKQFSDLSKNNRLRPSPLTAAQQLQRISVTDSLDACVSGCTYIQECVPESLELKEAVMKSLDSVISPSCVVGSSTSTFKPSLFTSKCDKRARMVVAHPVNPPYYLRLVEVVPAPWTDADAVDLCVSLMRQIGQAPVKMSREVDGFSLNRIQYAILNEVWHQVDQGLISPADIDVVMKEGLGPRYALMGPLETIHLNAHGVRDYLQKYSKSILAVSQTLDAPVLMDPESKTASVLQSHLEKEIPLEALGERTAWRNLKLAEMAGAKSADPLYKA